MIETIFQIRPFVGEDGSVPNEHCFRMRIDNTGIYETRIIEFTNDPNAKGDVITNPFDFGIHKISRLPVENFIEQLKRLVDAEYSQNDFGGDIDTDFLRRLGGVVGATKVDFDELQRQISNGDILHAVHSAFYLGKSLEKAYVIRREWRAKLGNKTLQGRASMTKSLRDKKEQEKLRWQELVAAQFEKKLPKGVHKWTYDAAVSHAIKEERARTGKKVPDERTVKRFAPNIWTNKEASRKVKSIGTNRGNTQAQIECEREHENLVRIALGLESFAERPGAVSDAEDAERRQFVQVIAKEYAATLASAQRLRERQKADSSKIHERLNSQSNTKKSRNNFATIKPRKNRRNLTRRPKNG